ncbi:hypothetical protein BGZ96_006599 [Linnemannia gamsii]|uniref:Uncharacterized protein n=1 Tax=Linnemannia gamsii TaxID=64522 RepID=A0ABQ7KGP6_9FUNG|nr:hypothetical protein BGZ96_006599 [Linnemannia gamsii]
MEDISRQGLTLATPPQDPNEAGEIGTSNNPSEPSDRGIRAGTAGGATQANSATLFSSGPPRSNFLNCPSLEDLPLPTQKYHLPRTSMVSPILLAVMSASQDFTRRNYPFSSREEEDDDDKIVALDLNSQFPGVPSSASWESQLQFPAVPTNAPWKVHTGSNSNHSRPQTPRTASEFERPRTASETEERQRGKQTDRSIREGQNIQYQALGGQECDLNGDQILEILDDHDIDEERIIEAYYCDYGEQGDEGNEVEEGGDGTVAYEDTQKLIGNGKVKESRTFLQRVKKRLSALTKPKKTPEPA